MLCKTYFSVNNHSCILFGSPVLYDSCPDWLIMWLLPWLVIWLLPWLAHHMNPALIGSWYDTRLGWLIICLLPWLAQSKLFLPGFTYRRQNVWQHIMRQRYILKFTRQPTLACCKRTPFEIVWYRNKAITRPFPLPKFEINKCYRKKSMYDPPHTPTVWNY